MGYLQPKLAKDKYSPVGLPVNSLVECSIIELNHDQDIKDMFYKMLGGDIAIKLSPTPCPPAYCYEFCSQR